MATMNRLGDGNRQSGAWENSLVDDLAFIKKHLRYPIRKSTLGPAMFWAAALIGTSMMVFVTIGSNNGTVTNFLLTVNALILLRFTWGYAQTLRFQTIETDLFLQENREMLEGFLKDQQLLVFRHPELPEVFQILSRNLMRTSNEEKREVIIFIADDKRILINSHFTGNFLARTAGRRHHKQMAKKLKEWIKNNHHTETAPVHRRF